MVDPSDDYEDRARSQRELDKYERLHKEARELKQELTTKIKTILENQSFKDYFAYTSRNLCNSLHLASGIKDSSFLGMLIPYTSKEDLDTKTKMAILNSILQKTLVIAKQLMH